MTGEISYLTAVIAGMISFISPCVLPLVPPYLCYMAGTSLENLTNDAKPDGGAAIVSARTVVLPSVLFVLGFSTVFVALGAGASSIGALVRSQMDILAIIAGCIIIVMGLHFLGIFRIGLLYREARFQGGGAGLAGAFIMGLAFAFGWTPCIGPVLGVILGMASAKASVGEGATMLAFYSAGLGIPFILSAMFVGPFMNLMTRFRQHLGTVEKVMGGLLVLTGILFITGGLQRFSFWLLEMFPVLGTIG
ncbi:MAG: cytochrome c biogenesis CcdA family protein [Rhizobiaceae bacterium]